MLTTTYQSEGNRWIVVPTVMVTLTLGRRLVRLAAAVIGSIWPVSLSHSAFNNLMETVAGVAIATSPATMAYVTTETGVATMMIMVLVAGYLLIRRAADFDKAKPEGTRPLRARGRPPIPAPVHNGHAQAAPARPLIQEIEFSPDLRIKGAGMASMEVRVRPRTPVISRASVPKSGAVAVSAAVRPQQGGKRTRTPLTFVPAARLLQAS